MWQQTGEMTSCKAGTVFLVLLEGGRIRKGEKIEKGKRKYSKRIRKALKSDKETESMWGMFLSEECSSGRLMALHVCYVI